MITTTFLQTNEQGGQGNDSITDLNNNEEILGIFRTPFSIFDLRKYMYTHMIGTEYSFNSPVGKKVQSIIFDDVWYKMSITLEKVLK